MKRGRKQGIAMRRGRKARRGAAALVAALAVAAVIVAVFAATATAAEKFSITEMSGSYADTGGQSQLAAGAHPDLTTSIAFGREPGPNEGTQPAGNVKDIHVKLPAGFVGYGNAAPTCTVSELSAPPYGEMRCSPETQIGVVTIDTFFFGFVNPTTLPLYNIEPPSGYATEFGFNVARVLVFLKSKAVDDGGTYRVETSIDGISQGLALGDTQVTLWGVPADASHDPQRYQKGGSTPGAQSDAPHLPLLRNPTSCGNAAVTTQGEADSWQEPGVMSSSGFDTDTLGNPVVFGGCEAVPFTGLISAQPTTHSADSPSGLDVTVTIPQNKNPQGLGSSDLRGAIVTLPEGMTINPASAGGLSSCSTAQIGLGNNEPAACPPDSRIGSVEIKSPLVDHSLDGSVFLAKQGENKFGALLAAYITVEDPASGTILKLPGKIATDPKTGRVVASFDENPQLPFETLNVKFFGGPRAPLTTPPTCGDYTTSAVLTPWSGTAPARPSDSFAITSGPDGSACPNGAFGPKLETSVGNPLAGSYSPLQLRVSRADGSGRLGSFTVKLPEGLLANLSGVPYCPDAALAAVPTAEGTGAAQSASPSCPAASRVGSVSVGAGSGTSPFYVNTGSVYLAGPYKGAPLSLAIVTPAVAGPFDLGNVVVRTALRVDPETAVVTAVTDPLPTILDGIPLDLRDVRVAIDRKQFTVQPTSCEMEPFGGSATSVTGASAPLASPYAAVGCAGLPFSPQLKLRVKGRSRRAGYPALVAKLAARGGDANIGAVTVALPHSEFLAQNHIGTVCTRPSFAAETCPKRSIYGFAEATTPLLAEPLRGPVYLRANGGERKLPDLVAALRGQIDINLVGYIDSKKGGIRTRFVQVPDAPITSFTLRMKGGKKSLLENSTDLCGAKHKASVSMVGQNGKRHNVATPVTPSCRKGKGKGKGKKGGK